MTEVRDVKKNDDYATQLGGLLPAEITGVYISIRALFPDPEGVNLQTFYLLGLALVLGVVSYFVLPQFVQIAQRLQRVLYVLSFYVWVATIEVARVSLIVGDGIKPLLLGVCLIWTFAVPYLFKSLATA